MSQTRLTVSIVVGILAAVLVLFVVYQATQPQNCGLQRLEVSNGDRALSELDDSCR